MRQAVVLAAALVLAAGCSRSDHPMDIYPVPDAGTPGADGGQVDGGDCANPCGDVCCDSGESCYLGACCAPQCEGRECGSDGCGGICGECQSPEVCVQETGLCDCTGEGDQALCELEEIECGAMTATDRCGVERTVPECGPCASGQGCGPDQRCVVCRPDSDAEVCERLGRVCGSVEVVDDCGDPRLIATCGGCTSPQICKSGFWCGEPDAPDNDICAGAVALAFDETGTARYSGDTTFADDSVDGSCQSRSGGDVVLAFTLTAPKSVTVEAIAAAGSAWRPLVSLRAGCDQPETEVGCEYASSEGSIALAIPRLEAGTYYLWVDSYASASKSYDGPFEVTLTTFEPPPPPDNHSCATAKDLDFGGAATGRVAIAGSTAAAGRATSGSCDLTSGGEVYYRLSIGAEAALRATVTSQDAGSGYAPAVYLRSECASASHAHEVACATGATAATVVVPRLPAGEYWLVVDGSRASSGDFQLEVELLEPREHDDCGRPMPVAIDPATGVGVLRDDSLIATDTIGSSCVLESVRDLVYVFEVPAGHVQHAVVEVAPEAGSAFRPSLSVRTSCADRDSELVCLRKTAAAPATIVLPNLPAGAYYVWVEGSSATTNGPFALRVALTDAGGPPTNDACDGAEKLAFDARTGVALASGSTLDALNDYAGTCADEAAGGHRGGDRVYAFTLEQETSVSVVLARAEANDTFAPTVYVRSAVCGDSRTELACAHSTSSLVRLALPKLAAGTYYLFVDGQGSFGGSYTLEVGAYEPGAPSSCASARPLPFDASGRAFHRGETCGAGNDSLASTTCTNLSTGEDVVDRVELPSEKNLEIALQPGHFGEPLIYLQSACGVSEAKLHCSRGARTGGVHRTQAKHLPEGTYFLWVDAEPGRCGIYTLEVLATDPPPAPSHDTCEGAVKLSFDAAGVAPATGDTFPARDSGDGSCRLASGAGDLVYFFTLTEPRRVEVHASPQTPSSLHRPMVSLRSACERPETERACATGGTDPVSGLPLAEPAALVIPRLGAGTWYVWVDGALPGVDGPFELRVAISDPGSAPSNDVCGGAQSVSLGTGTPVTVTGSTANAADDFEGTCAAAGQLSNGPDLVYSFTLAADATVTATVARQASSPAFLPIVYLRKACEQVASEGACARETGGKATLAAALPAGTYYLVVDGLAGTSGDFTLELSQSSGEAVPPGDGCFNARPLSFDSAGVARVTGDTRQALPTDAGSCGGTGADEVWSMTLKAENTVEVTLTPDAGSALRPRVYLRSTCADAKTQLACHSASAGESLSMRFGRLKEGTYYLWIDSQQAQYAGPYSLEVRASTPVSPPQNEDCATAEELAFDSVSGIARVEGSTLFAADDLRGGCESAEVPHNGGDVVYRFTLTQPMRFHATLRRAEGTSRRDEAAVLLLRSACGPATPYNERQCQAGANQPGWGLVDLGEETLPPGTWYLVVDGENLSAADFTLEVAAVPPATITASSCDAPAMLAIDDSGRASRVGDTALGAANHTGTCGSSTTVSELVYGLELTKPHDVTVRVTPLGLGLAPAVYVRTVCDQTNSEIACGRRVIGGESLSLTLPDLPAGTYYVIVDAYSSQYPWGLFHLEVETQELTPPPLNDTCASAIVLQLKDDATTTVTGTTLGGTDDYRGTCEHPNWPHDGPDFVYAFELAEARTVRARITRVAPDVVYSPALYVRTQCESGAPEHEAFCSFDSFTSGGTNYTATLPRGFYYLFVDGVQERFGPFTLELTLGPEVPGETCLNPIDLTFDGMGVAQASGALTAAYGNDTGASCNASGKDVVYRFELPREKSVTIRAEPQASSSFRPAIYLRTSCADRASDIFCSMVNSANTPVVWKSVRLPEGTYYLWLDSPAASRDGPYTLTVTAADPIPLDAGDTCPGEELTFVREETLKATVEVDLFRATHHTAGSCDDGAGPDRVYFFTTNEATMLTATATADVTSGDAFRPVLYLRSACAEEAVWAEVACRRWNAAAPLTVSNLPAGTWYLFVDSTAGTGGLLTLEVTLASAVPGAPANDSCHNPEPMVWTGTAFTATGTTAGANDDSKASCDNNGADVVYSVTTTAAHKVVATLTPSGGFAGSLYLRKSCAERRTTLELACASSNKTDNSPRVATANYVPAGTWYLWVGPGRNNAAGAFSLEVKLETPVLPPANDTCDGAIPVLPGTSYTGDTTNAFHDYGDKIASAECAPWSTGNPTGPDVVYAYTPLADGPFTATLTCTGGQNGYLWVMENGCDIDGHHCTALANSAGYGGTETLTMQGVAGQTYYLIVDGLGSPPAGTFTFEVR